MFNFFKMISYVVSMVALTIFATGCIASLFMGCDWQVALQNEIVQFIAVGFAIVATIITAIVAYMDLYED